MNITKHYKTKCPKVNGPHNNYGNFECTNWNEAEYSLMIDYTEKRFKNLEVDNCAVSIVRGHDKWAYFVNGKSGDIVKMVIDAEVDILQKGFRKKGIEVLVT